MARPCATPAQGQAARKLPSSPPPLHLTVSVDVLMPTEWPPLVPALIIALLHRIGLVVHVLLIGRVRVNGPVLHSGLIHRRHGGNCKFVQRTNFSQVH